MLTPPAVFQPPPPLATQHTAVAAAFPCLLSKRPPAPKQNPCPAADTAPLACDLPPAEQWPHPGEQPHSHPTGRRPRVHASSTVTLVSATCASSLAPTRSITSRPRILAAVTTTTISRRFTAFRVTAAKQAAKRERDNRNVAANQRNIQDSPDPPQPRSPPHGSKTQRSTFTGTDRRTASRETRPGRRRGSESLGEIRSAGWGVAPRPGARQGRRG